jgi:UDP-N-acetylmuramoyl-tripeptide--D-alanyl-D-alanine ligase
MTLSYSWAQLAELSGGQLEKKGTNVPTNVPLRVVVDSRAVQKGDLFVALKGDRRDGHDFLKGRGGAGSGGSPGEPANGIPAL